MAALLMRDVKAAIKFFETHPRSAIHGGEGTGFHH
jgi:hypothetical protein